MFEKLVSGIFGYVDFYIYGKYPERLISLAARNGIRVWNIESGAVFSCTSSIGGYKELRVFRKKCGCKTRIYKKNGLPFKIKKVARRKGLLAGAAAFVIIYLMLFSYIWSVDVEGNEKISSEKILRTASECGLNVGTLKGDIDPYLIETRLMRRLPELGWVSVNIYGCASSISVKEKITAPEIIDTAAPTNIIAGCSGQIVALEIFGGEARVKVGDGVSEGQLLVSGVVSVNGESTALKHSYGRVMAETHHRLTVTIPAVQKEQVKNGEEIYRCTTSLFGIQIPLTFCGRPRGSYKCETREKPFKVGGVVLPVSILEEKWSGYDIVEKRVGKSEAGIIAEKLLKEKFKSEFPKAEITDKKTKIRENENGYYITWEVTCREDIGRQAAVLKN